MSPKPILLVKFDGVIHSGSSASGVIDGPPVDGAFEFLLNASKFFDVHIDSARTNQEGGTWAMSRWLKRHGWPTTGAGGPQFLTFAIGKLTAFLTIDDRCFLFKGDWPDPEQLTRFEAWTGKKL